MATTVPLTDLTEVLLPLSTTTWVTDGDLYLNTETVMSSTAASGFIEEKIAILIDRIYIPLVVFFGMVGNFLTFFTLTLSSLRQTSTCVYMAIVALADSVVLTLDLCVLIRGYMGHTEFYLHNSWACGFHNFLFYFCIHFVTLVLLAMTVDRYLVVKFPLKAQSWCTPKSATKVMLGLGLFSFVLNFQIFFTRRLLPSGISTDPLRCWYPDPEVDFFMQKIYTWIDASIYSFIPFLSLLVLNVLIIRQLRKSRNFSRKFTERQFSKKDNSSNIPMSSSAENEGMRADVYTVATSCTSSDFSSACGQIAEVSNSINGSCQTLNESIDSGTKVTSRSTFQRPTWTKTRNPSWKNSTSGTSTNVTVMLLLVSFTFLLLTSPVVILLLYQRYYWLPATDCEKARARLAHAFVDNLMYTNHAVNFLLYCLSGRRFRLEFKRLLSKFCFCCQT